ncbi:DUF4352 domain-containing protein [candidate division WWE3 bacterium]|nr:DUF4352 domain-containing protein [candidate division WWE3 bacterium]
MKKKDLITIIAASVLLLGTAWLIFRPKAQIDEEGGTRTKKEKIVTDEISYEKGDTKVTVVRNKVTKSADISTDLPVADDDEYTEFLGETVTTAPFLVNLTCSAFNEGFFAEESNLSEDQKEIVENFKEGEDYESYLSGYSIEHFTINFNDEETGEKIAKCSSNKAGFENIAFEVFRDYSEYGSFLGMKIGEIPEDEGTSSNKDNLEIVQANVGETIKTATYELTVESFEESQELPASYGEPHIAREGAKFVTVNLKLVNTTNSEFDFNPDSRITLEDSAGRTFETYDDSIGIEDYLDYRTLGPSLAEKGKLFYEIPADASSYSLIVLHGNKDIKYKIPSE